MPHTSKNALFSLKSNLPAKDLPPAEPGVRSGNVCILKNRNALEFDGKD